MTKQCYHNALRCFVGILECRRWGVPLYCRVRGPARPVPPCRSVGGGGQRFATAWIPADRREGLTRPGSALLAIHRHGCFAPS